MVRESTSGRQDCGISDGRRSTARATAGFETFPGKEEISGGTETIREDCPDCSRNFRSIEIESELDAPRTLRVLCYEHYKKKTRTTKRKILDVYCPHPQEICSKRSSDIGFGSRVRTTKYNVAGTSRAPQPWMLILVVSKGRILLSAEYYAVAKIHVKQKCPAVVKRLKIVRFRTVRQPQNFLTVAN